VFNVSIQLREAGVVVEKFVKTTNERYEELDLWSRVMVTKLFYAESREAKCDEFVTNECLAAVVACVAI